MSDQYTPESAEKYLLSMCFTRVEDMKEAIKLGLESKHFFDERTQAIYAAAVQDFIDHDSLEPDVFVAQHAKDKTIGLMGGIPYFSEITNDITSSENVRFWVEEIKDAYQRRTLKGLAENAATQTDNPELTPHSIAAALANRALDVINEHEKPVTISAAVDDALDVVSNIADGVIDSGTLGIPTPIDSINRFLGMPRPGELITIAARPGGGKSSMLRALNRHIAETTGRTLFCSREMSIKELVYIFAQEASGVSWKHIRENTAPKDHVDRFKKGLERIKSIGGRLVIDDRDRTADQVVARISASARGDNPLCAVAVDYLQRYDMQQHRGETRDVAIGRFTMALKDAAIKHEIPVFMGAQLGRLSERENRQPRLSDLRESGNIEQDSDRVWFLWIPSETPEGDPQDPNDHRLPIVHVKLIQAKGRGDGLGTINLAFYRNITTFREWESVRA